MRLLNAKTLQVEEFTSPSLPPYAILSHTWTDDEASLQDLTLYPTLAAEKTGFQKIRWLATQTLADGLTHCWADTCCIDKTSSAELSEAINSMFRYYRDSEFCYVYLADVNIEPAEELGEAVSRSRWFTRGWTLQELVAPRNRFFFDAEWNLIGKILPEVDVMEEGPPPTPSKFRSSLMDVEDAEGFPLSIALDQRIPLDLLCHRTTLSDYCVAEKMIYAIKRSTTRPEDRSYSLLGIFDVNMPLLYGEGGERAFQRLQEEIIKKDFDHSIFDWELQAWDAPFSTFRGLLARSPDDFTVRRRYVDQREHEHRFQFPYSMTNRGLKMKLAMIPTKVHPGEYFASLNCRSEGRGSIITLAQVGAHDQYARVDVYHDALDGYSKLDKRIREEGSAMDICVRQQPVVGPRYTSPRVETWIIQPPPPILQLYLREVLPKIAWSPSERTIKMNRRLFGYVMPDCGYRCARVVFQCKSGWSYVVRLRCGPSVEGGCDQKIARIDSGKYRKLISEEADEEDTEDITYADTVEYEFPNVPTLRHPATWTTMRNDNNSQPRDAKRDHGVDDQSRSMQLGLECVSKIVDDKLTVVVKLSIVTQGPQPRGLYGVHLSPTAAETAEKGAPHLLTRKTM